MKLYTILQADSGARSAVSRSTPISYMTTGHWKQRGWPLTVEGWTPIWQDRKWREQNLTRHWLFLPTIKKCLAEVILIFLYIVEGLYFRLIQILKIIRSIQFMINFWNGAKITYIFLMGRISGRIIQRSMVVVYFSGNAAVERSFSEKQRIPCWKLTREFPDWTKNSLWCCEREMYILFDLVGCITKHYTLF